MNLEITPPPGFIYRIPISPDRAEQMARGHIEYTYGEPFKPPKLPGTDEPWVLGMAAGLPNEIAGESLVVAASNFKQGANTASFRQRMHQYRMFLRANGERHQMAVLKKELQEKLTAELGGNIVYITAPGRDGRIWEEILQLSHREMNFLEQMFIDDSGSTFYMKRNAVISGDRTATLDIVRSGVHIKVSLDFFPFASVMTEDPDGGENSNGGVAIFGREYDDSAGQYKPKARLIHVASAGAIEEIDQIETNTNPTNIFSIGDHKVLITSGNTIIIADTQTRTHIKINFENADKTVFLPDSKFLMRAVAGSNGFSVDVFTIDPVNGLIVPVNSGIVPFPTLPPGFVPNSVNLADGDFLYRGGVLSFYTLFSSSNPQATTQSFPVHIAIGVARDGEIVPPLYVNQPPQESFGLVFAGSESGNTYMSGHRSIYPFEVRYTGGPTPTPTLTPTSTATPESKANIYRRVYLPFAGNGSGSDAVTAGRYNKQTVPPRQLPRPTRWSAAIGRSRGGR